MKPIFYLVFFLFPVLLSSQEKYTRVLKLMGSRFDITVVADSETEGNKYIDLAVAEISRIEKMISSWDTLSETAKIVENAGIQPVKVDEELFDLIGRSIKISELTSGAFDISYASMDRIWKFDGSMKERPTKEEVAASVSKVGYKNIIFDPQNQTVFLKNKGMRIGFGALGKGYAADKAKQLLISKGVKAGIINASGDLTTWGTQPDKTPWMVGITNPLNKNKVFSWFPLDNSSVVTSGNYEKYVEFNGIKYTHIIDPRTGWPVSGLTSVSIFAPKAELADALATSVFVMGKETGLDFINQLPGVECVIVDDQGKIYNSENIKLNSTK
ncbi:FAD:protein FMN transferase [Maribellus comscasis]|nr:FAD:protein FMN transferase [Maribellus comscasis]